jgi:hypothetical protein
MATERQERTTLVLTSEINAWRQRAAMRQKTGTCMSRSEMLRAIVRATAEWVEEPGISDCRDAKDIAIVMFLGPADLANRDKYAATPAA